MKNSKRSLSNSWHVIDFSDQLYVRWGVGGGGRLRGRGS
jgi:hypothetical protein